MNLRPFLWLMVGLLLLPGAAMADDPFIEGKGLFERGEYAAAIEKLQQLCREEPGNLDASFYLGRAAYEAGDYERAVVAFERILIKDPDARRVKLELARAYLKLGSRDIAREYFKSVQATNPPPAVWRQIQQFIDTIDAVERRHLFNGFITLGAFYDDNVGAVASSDSVNVPGLGEVALDQQVETDAGAQATAVVNHVYRFIDTPYVWKSTLTTYNNFYDDQTDYDLNYLGLNTGLLRQDDQSLSELQLLVGQIDLSSDRYLGLWGVNLNHTRFLTRYLQLNLGGYFQDKTYYQEDYRDAETWGGSINPVLVVKGNRVSLNLAGEREDAEQGNFDYQRAAAELRYDRQLPADFSAYIGFRWQQTDYDDEDPTFYKTRSDEQTHCNIGLSKVLWRSTDRKQMLATQVNYSYIDNESNLDLYTYDKGVVMTSLTFAF